MSESKADSHNPVPCFKFNSKLKDAHRRKKQLTIELRTGREDGHILKRRNISFDEETISPLSPPDGCTIPPFSSSIEEIVLGMKSSDEIIQLQATEACRKMLSREKNPPIDSMIQQRLVRRCIEFLDYNHNEALQFLAAAALTNVASGTSKQTHIVVKHGAVPKLVSLLKSASLNVAEQAVWALGNIAGDGPAARDLVLANDAMPALLDIIKPVVSVTFTRNIVWTLSNLCRYKKPQPPFEIVKTALPVLNRLLSSNDENVLANACWALCYLTDGPNDKIQAVFECGVVPKLVELLASNKVTVLTPALRAVANILTGNNDQTDAIISAGGLQQLCALLQCDHVHIITEAAWAISNITAGNVAQIEHVINAGLLPPLIDVLGSGDFKSQKQALWAVTNITSGGTVEQLIQLVQMGVIEDFCNLLDAKDWEMVLVVIDGLTNILYIASKMGKLEQFTRFVEKVGGLDKLDNLQTHENEQVYQKAFSIINTYFSDVIYV